VTAPVEPAPPSKPAGPALGEGTPAAEIADLREGTTSLGGRYWLMTYKNTGTAVIDRPSVLVKLTDRREFIAKVLGSDKLTDIAVLKIEARGLPAVARDRPGRRLEPRLRPRHRSRH
jgi:serine protease Do